MSDSRGDLTRYRGKRSADRTPEPFGGGASGRPGLFVVQQHGARSLHWDLRLEWNGVLLSWAVPRGPSLDPGDRRLAVQVEEHPVEYADFEGVIPEGNYGAGPVILWDRGRWQPVEDPDAGLASGKLLFDLEGYKLRGRFTLVRTGGRDAGTAREWLLIKKPDPYAREGEAPPGAEASILSGLTLEELRHGAPRLERLERAVARSAAPRERLDPARVRPMLAERMERPFSRRGWLFEVKIDGYRMIGARSGGQGLLFSRNGRAMADRFPEIARSLAALPVESAVLDGEVAVTDLEGRPHFQRLQQRALRTRVRDVERASIANPATYFVFDLLALGDRDLRSLPLARRKAWLAQLIAGTGPLRIAEHFEERGEELYAQVERHGLEGIVAKRADAPYRAGRSSAWRKLRVLATDDFAVVGYTPPRGGRSGFGALHLATCRDGAFVYAGRVGSGFRESELVELAETLARTRRETPPCTGALPQSRGHVWVEPTLVCEVRYAEVTEDGLLRQPVFLRMREDKTPQECHGPAEGATLAESEGAPDDEPASPSVDPGASTDAAQPSFTNVEKVFWPADGTTKGDLLAYYREIAPWLLPYLRDRPLVMTRFPDGIQGRSFFQKDAPEWVPDWVRTERLWSEQAQREVSYFVCDDVEALLYVINMGTIPLHVWSSRVTALQRPDWSILDLDPKGAPFGDVVRVARAIRELCGELELPAFPKTSGSSGLHVLVPLAGALTYEQSRSFAELLARVVVARLPEIATVTRRVGARRGRVYVDYLQNGHGRLLVSPFSVRPLPGAPVSMPLRWREVAPRLEIGRHTIRSARRRMVRLGEDPIAGVLGPGADLARALARLEARIGGA